MLAKYSQAQGICKQPNVNESNHHHEISMIKQRLMRSSAIENEKSSRNEAGEKLCGQRRQSTAAHDDIAKIAMPINISS